MKRSRLQAGFSILVLLVIGAGLGFELKESVWPDRSAAAPVGGLGSHWRSQCSEAAAELANFPGDGEETVWECA
jgi:hypothetical protein